jgi:ABC-type Fe3+/spermidine/putrescine transport system ATPase subunit
VDEAILADDRMTRSPTSLEVQEARVCYGAHCVLDRISLVAAGGEFVALLGSSGCGKTTLLRAICGFVGLTSGGISVGGRDVTRLPPDRRNVAMVFHSVLRSVAAHDRRPEHGLRVEVAPCKPGRRAIEDAAIGGARRTQSHRAFGRPTPARSAGPCIGGQTRILLLDEPLSNLDARVREEVRHKIKTLQQNLGITTLHVTHDRQEAMVMADRIATLDAGHIAQIGAPDEIYNRPNSPFVASFKGAANAVPLIVCRSGPYNRSVTIDAPRFLTRGIGEICAETSMVAHFPSEDARLCPLDQTSEGCLVLHGQITQTSYPGGFYRHMVSVGPGRYLVDDVRRLAAGEAIGVALPATALHLYPAPYTQCIKGRQS